mmetsp:Transcript_92392/g.198031  ORF Transcript_92392/g.198031 Transcript_92392/m.198031 type:complete len:726 (+) Transcript_92392:62-2239(+)
MAEEPTFDVLDWFGVILAAVSVAIAGWLWTRWEVQSKEDQYRLEAVKAEEENSKRLHAAIALGAKNSSAVAKMKAVETIDPPDAGKVNIVTSSADGLRHKGSDCSFEYGPMDFKKAQVIVDAGLTYQTFLGFGGSFTETACHLLQAAGDSTTERVMKAYYSSAGLNYTFARTHMNSCDFSAGNWSCCEKESKELEGFSVDRYESNGIFPLLRKAKEMAGGELKVVVSPWSPPPWMKDNNRMQFGGVLKSEWRQTWADFYVRFAKETEKAGLPLWAFTVQNEPMAKTIWESCVYTAAAERDFVRDFLGPTLGGSGLDVKLLVWDHNRDEMVHRAQTIYSDPEASKYVWGMGYHWYGDPAYEIWPERTGQVAYDALKHVHDLYPEKHIMLTECCQENGPHLYEWGIGERYASNIINDLNNWSEAWVDWNLVLDSNGGPNHTGNMCSAPVLMDTAKSNSLLFQPAYFVIGHFSRHIQPGAQRIVSSCNRDALQVTAFANPDGTIVLIVLNKFDVVVEFDLKFNGRIAKTKQEAHTISTYVFNNDPEEEEDNAYVWTWAGIEMTGEETDLYDWPHEGAPFRQAHEDLFKEKAGLDLEKLLSMGICKPSGKEIKEKEPDPAKDPSARAKAHADAREKAAKKNEERKLLGSPKAKAKSKAKAKAKAKAVLKPAEVAPAQTTAAASTAASAAAPTTQSNAQEAPKKWWVPLVLALVGFLLGRVTGRGRSLTA